MTFREHLEELRRRLLAGLGAIVLAMVCFLLFKDGVTRILMGPYHSAWGTRLQEWYENDYPNRKPGPEDPRYLVEDYERIPHYYEKLRAGEKVGDYAVRTLKDFGFHLPPNLLSLSPLQDIITYMLASMLFGFVVAAPILLHQMWRFIAAGLYERERKAVMHFLPPSLLLFAGGGAFGYFVMVPMAMSFLTSASNPEFVQFAISVRFYFNFLFILTVALGFVFQLPIVMVGLTRFGVCKPGFFTRYWRHAVLTMFIIGAFFTPPDPITQILMAVPMAGLYGVGILLSNITYRRMERASEEGS